MKRLECGHLCCARCEETLRAFAVARHIAAGEKEEDWDGKALCLACMDEAMRGREDVSGGMVAMERFDFDDENEKIVRMCEDAKKEVREARDKLVREVYAECEECKRKVDEFVRINEQNEEKRLNALGVLEEMTDICVRNGLVELLQEILCYARVLSKPMNELCVFKEGRHVCAKEMNQRSIVSLDEILSMKVDENSIPTEIFDEYWGTVFDSQRNIIFSRWNDSRTAMDIHIMKLGINNGKKTTTRENIVPFGIACRILYDNNRHLYFIEEDHNPVCDGDDDTAKRSKKRFGRLNLDTMEFEELRNAQWNYCYPSGFYYNGCM